MSETLNNSEQHLPKAKNDSTLKEYKPAKIDSSIKKTEDEEKAQWIKETDDLVTLLWLNTEKPSEGYWKIERPEWNFKKPEKPDEWYSLRNYFEWHWINVKWDNKTGITLIWKEWEINLSKDDYTIFTWKANINRDLAWEMVAVLTWHKIIKDNNQKTEKPQESYEIKN